MIKCFEEIYCVTSVGYKSQMQKLTKVHKVNYYLFYRKGNKVYQKL